MIDARTAYEKTRFQKQIINFKADIEQRINDAISKGEYECEVMFDCDLPDSIRDEISNELKEKGYDYYMPAYEKQPSDIPCDQAKYYDYLKIMWGVENG